jgi:hypothetical protein
MDSRLPVAESVVDPAQETVSNRFFAVGIQKLVVAKVETLMEKATFQLFND